MAWACLRKLLRVGVIEIIYPWKVSADKFAANKKLKSIRQAKTGWDANLQTCKQNLIPIWVDSSNYVQQLIQTLNLMESNLLLIRHKTLEVKCKLYNISMICALDSAHV